MLSNIWKNPKTSINGILVFVAVTAPVLQSQGVTFGHVGTGTWIGLTSALVYVWIKLLAKDSGGAA